MPMSRSLTDRVLSSGLRRIATWRTEMRPNHRLSLAKAFTQRTTANPIALESKYLLLPQRDSSKSDKLKTNKSIRFLPPGTILFNSLTPNTKDLMIEALVNNNIRAQGLLGEGEPLMTSRFSNQTKKNKKLHLIRLTKKHVLEK